MDSIYTELKYVGWMTNYTLKCKTKQIKLKVIEIKLNNHWKHKYGGR